MSSLFKSRWALGLLAIPLLLWAGVALALRLPGPAWVRVALGVLLPAVAWLWVLMAPRRGRWAVLVVFAGTLLFFFAQRPSNHRAWMADVAHIPTATVQGSRLTVQNVRHCRYGYDGDMEVRFEERSYDLDHLTTLDLFLVSWGPRHIAHTLLSFGFDNGDHLAFSIETRKERGEAYSALKGFFREYELCIVAGDERDLVLLRTNHRKEQVRLYPLTVSPPTVRTVLLDYVARINELAAQPEWYNALTKNCTTAMDRRVRSHSKALPWSWKLVVSGHLDEYLYEHDLLDRSLPFDELRRRALINGVAQDVGDDPAFSARIREGLKSH
ncbi:MAG: DUF4105 domain-containing protein [Firmicutes bacterium]|nr:DUF4105 domain-containing protein [Bacillota bacterium]